MKVLLNKLLMVFLVCIYVDELYNGCNVWELVIEIYGFLKNKLYGFYLFGVFVVDNIKLGSELECG